jgi:bacillithiol biosynthesis cysteine-adding enzyme BshC
MENNCEYISYKSTGFFSGMMIDYINGDDKLHPFYSHPVSIEGIKKSIDARKDYTTDRSLLIAELQKQYKGISLAAKQQNNLELLADANTFTVCTAHQPVIFTGPLYFIYKILHAIKLADHLNEEIQEYKFVPFFYMGSEDADLDELGHIHINGERLGWDTKQTGAVGRMKVDKGLIKLIDRIAGQIAITEAGRELADMFRLAYKEGATIQEATLQLVNELFKDFGLLILIPDNAELKRQFNPVVKKELTAGFSHPLVEETCSRLSKNYKQQASGREINLFYLSENKRERIEKLNDKFRVIGEKIEWTEEEILAEVDAHPDRFSANVILRGLFQETVLPNIAFIGGGGETAYWLELKKVFEAVNIPFPMLIVRNSFLLHSGEQKQLAARLGFKIEELFQPAGQLVNMLVTRESNIQLTLADEKEQLEIFYNRLREVSGKVDVTLAEHTANLRQKAFEKLEALEKKMLRAEKKKFEAQQRQVNKLKHLLFPNNSLQERMENFSPFYSAYGQQFLQLLYTNSLTMEQQFAILQLP